jgi:phosphate transport system permease protein
MSEPTPTHTTSQPAKLVRFSMPRIGDAVFAVLTGAFGVAILVLFAGLLVLLAQRAWPAMHHFGIHFLWSRAWNPPGQDFGALPYIFGTISTSLIALAFTLPIAIGAAIALTDLLPRAVASVLGIMIELLAALPSIVFGVWGLAVITPFVKQLGGDRTFGPSILAAGLVLCVMILPIVTAVTRDMIFAVPRSQREAAYALGATRWEVTWRVVLPNARPGITAAVILGLGRAVGETMAVIMVIGNQPRLTTDVFKPGSTIASVIANEFGDPSGPLHFSSLVYLGFILLAISLALNVVARVIVHRYSRFVQAV